MSSCLHNREVVLRSLQSSGHKNKESSGLLIGSKAWLLQRAEGYFCFLQGKMGTGETVLVTAAAGGTGQFAVQLAKLAGNTVIATCGGAEKAALLRGLGVDRVIDYRQEDVGQVNQLLHGPLCSSF
jgi:NADPH:quinone reductase-like Zn-dependent oxidoreductase